MWKCPVLHFLAKLCTTIFLDWVHSQIQYFQLRPAPRHISKTHVQPGQQVLVRYMHTTWHSLSDITHANDYIPTVVFPCWHPARPITYKRSARPMAPPFSEDVFTKFRAMTFLFICSQQGGARLQGRSFPRMLCF